MQCILYMYLCGTLFIALNQLSLFPMNYGLNDFFKFQSLFKPRIFLTNIFRSQVLLFRFALH